MATRARPLLTSRQRGVISKIFVTSLATAVLVSFIAPLGYMFTTGLKSYDQISDQARPGGGLLHAKHTPIRISSSNFTSCLSRAAASNRWRP
jgi:ABC-type glycerol-3-phosphate transport system permease component